MSRFTVRLYPSATFDSDTEEWDLGEPGEMFDEFDAPYPAAAIERALGGLRLDLRGMAFLTTTQAVAAWETHLGAVALKLVRE